jgi:phosphoribosyl-dephospho-CoA transferase
MNRHDLVFVSPIAWQTLLSTRIEMAGDSLVANWVHCGWPLVGRRAGDAEGLGVPLGLPLPPSAGKKRIAFLMRPEDVVAIMPPPSLTSAIRAAPLAWHSTLLNLTRLATRESVEARVFGSLAWRAITSLDYLTDRSDLDFALYVHRGTKLRTLADVLARLEADAPMRLDGELIRSDGAAVNWRELHAGASEVLVKTAAGIALVDTARFLSGGMPS